MRESLEVFSTTSFRTISRSPFHPTVPPSGIEKRLFFNIFSKTHHLYVVLHAHYEYHIYILIVLRFLCDKPDLLINGLCVAPPTY